MIKISIVVAVFGTEHLFKRSIETYAKQDFPKDEWELIVISDNALGDVKSIIEPYKDRINIQYIEFNHPFGMRGNTISFNTAFMCSRGEYIGESTPETMWQPNVVRTLYETHNGADDTVVLMKTYNMTNDMQLVFDTVDWRSDIMNVKKLDGWDSDWVQQNFKKGTDFGTHQTCSIKKKTFYRITDNFLFPTYAGYGEEDPFYCGLRREKGIRDIVITDLLPIHQHHLPFGYFASLGHAPMLNRHSHTTSNYMNDVSGRVPEGGTCHIFDGGDTARMTDAEAQDWRKWDDYFLKSGGDPKYLINPNYDLSLYRY